QGAAGRNQNGQVGHVQKNGGQQLQEPALTRVDARQRHGDQRHDEDQDRQRQTPLQLCRITQRRLTIEQLTGRNRVAIAIAVRTNFLPALLSDQHGDPMVLLLFQFLFRDEHTTKIDAVVGHGFGVRDPTAIAQQLEATWHQRVELGHRILLVQQQLK
nr:hypothetical protein [Tanacetum cinerariifolium]